MNQMSFDDFYAKAKAKLGDVPFFVSQHVGTPYGHQFSVHIIDGEFSRCIAGGATAEQALKRLADFDPAREKRQRIQELEHELAELKGK